jgi:hypothetical protein
MNMRWFRPTASIVVLLALVFAPALACGDDEGDTTTTSAVAPIDDAAPDPVPTAPAEDAEGSAIVAVSIEDVEGIFVEGFEVGLRFETGDGEVIESTLWSEVVAAQDPSTPEAYYETVLEQPVPAGEVVVLGEANVGTGPGPSVPDLDGELPCRVELELDDGERAEVEVRFDTTDECLEQVS